MEWIGSENSFMTFLAGIHRTTVMFFLTDAVFIHDANIVVKRLCRTAKEIGSLFDFGGEMKWVM